MATKLGRMLIYLEQFTPVKLQTKVWSRGFVRSRDKLKPLYPHYHGACDHQTLPDGDLP